MVDGEEEHEVTLTLHQEHLEDLGKPLPESELMLKETLATEDEDELSEEPEKPERAIDRLRRINRASVEEKEPNDGQLRRKCSRTFVIAVVLVLLAIGTGIFVLWRFDVLTLSGQSRAGEASAEGRIDETRPSMVPSTSPAPSTPIPSQEPSGEPSTSQVPSVSALPTTSTPSMFPSITPGPSGSVLPSQVPSVSLFPTAPSSSPTDFPSFKPSASPTWMPSVTPTRPRVCNGLESNCDRRANEIMYASVHNAMSSQEDGFLGYNNLRRMEDAMEAGFRGFLVDSCDCGDEEGVLFCHSLCVAGTREPTPLFASVVSFLTRNEWDIMILEIQVTDDSLWGLWASTTAEFQDLIYYHADRDAPWPTLNEMIDMGRRLLVFQHNSGESCSEQWGCPVGVMNMFDHGFQTTWEVSGADELMNFGLSCVPKSGSTENAFMMLNHFANNRIGLPAAGISREVNTAAALQARLDACTSLIGRRTNILAVDFWSIGDTVQVVHENNARLTDDIFSFSGQ